MKFEDFIQSHQLPDLNLLPGLRTCVLQAHDGHVLIDTGNNPLHTKTTATLRDNLYMAHVMRAEYPVGDDDFCITLALMSAIELGGRISDSMAVALYYDGEGPGAVYFRSLLPRFPTPESVLIWCFHNM